VNSPPDLSGDRRPIAARGLRPVVRAADRLVRRRASPNAISVAGAIAACLAGLALAFTRHWPAAAHPLWLLAAVLVQARLMANLLDGMVAIGRGVASATGHRRARRAGDERGRARCLVWAVHGADPAHRRRVVDRVHPARPAGYVQRTGLAIFAFMRRRRRRRRAAAMGARRSPFWALPPGRDWARRGYQPGHRSADRSRCA